MARRTAEDQLATAEEFEAWVRPHWHAMARLANRLVGPNAYEDVLQEAVSAAWRKRLRFDPAKGSPRSWLLALVADQSRKQWRRDQRGWVLDVGAELSERADRYDSGGDELLDQVVARLASRQRVAVELFYFMDLPLREVARVMNCSEGTVKSTLSDARRRLRAMLEEHDEQH